MAARASIRPSVRLGRRRRRCESDRGDRGQATVELALAMPIVAIFLLAIVQVVVIVRGQVAVIHAAREGARAAAVSASPNSAAVSAARAGAGVAPVAVATSTAGKAITVTVRFVDHTNVPLIGALIPDVMLIGRVTMQFEPS